MSVLHKAQVRFALRHPGQFGLSAMGIAMGVALFVAIAVANGSVRRAFLRSAETLAGRATHVIGAGPGGVPERLWARLRRAGVAPVGAPVVEGDVMREPGGEVLHIMGVDVFAEAQVRPALAWAGTAATGKVGRVLTEPGAVVLPTATAARLGLGVGSTLAVRAGARLSQLQVVGLVDTTSGGADLAGTGNLVLMDVASAQELLDLHGALSRLDLVLSEAEVIQVQALLPAGVTLERAGARAGALSQMTRAFDLNLTALSLLALLVGAFLVANTLTFAVLRRRRELAILRTLGAVPADIVRMVLIEALVLGTVGAGLGVGFGVALARSLVGLVSRAVNDLYFVVDTPPVSVTAAPLLMGLALGLGGSVVAAWPAARQAAATTPQAVLLRSALEARSRGGARRLWFAGWGALAVAGLLVALPTQSLVLAFAALFLVVTGVAALAPAITQAAVRGCARLARARGQGRGQGRPLAGPLVRLALANVSGSLSRTGVAVAALATALSVSVGVTVMVHSFRQSVVAWLDATLVADVYVTAPQLVSSRTEARLPADLPARLRALPEVAGLSTYQGSFVALSRGRVFLVALDLDARQKRALRFLAGDGERAWAAFDAGEGVFVSEPWSSKYQRGVGDVITLPGRKGPVTLPIVAVFRDFGAESGTVMIHHQAAHRFFRERGGPGAAPSSIALFAASGVSADAVASAVQRSARSGEALLIRPSKTLRDMSLVIFDRTFAVTRVLQLLSLLVAALGVMGALLARALERTREVGLLRALGLSPSGVGRLLALENAIVGVMAGALAAPLGLLLAVLLVHVINRRSFGWSLDFTLAPSALLVAPAFGLLAALIAGLPPRAMARRISPAEALRDE
jgi:putative ABC transport system permease protein